MSKFIFSSGEKEECTFSEAIENNNWKFNDSVFVIVCSCVFISCSEIKKICMLFGFFLRVSSPDPPQPYRGFEKPLGHAGGPSGFFKSHLGFGGSGRRSPRKNPNNLYIF